MNTKDGRFYFPFLTDWENTINEIEDKETQLALYRAIIRYGLYAEEPQLTGVAKIVWTAIRPTAIHFRNQYENGKKGGAPKGNQNARKKNAPKWETPTLQDVRRYFSEIGSDCDPERFYNYFAEKQWKPTNPMQRTWQQAADDWAKRERR